MHAPGLKRLYTTLRETPAAVIAPDRLEQPLAARFKAAMDDDFNTADAVSVLFEIAGEVNRTRDARQRGAAQGIGRHPGHPAARAGRFLQLGSGESGVDPAQIEQLIEQRKAARKAKDFAEADRIRKDLEDKGVLLEDTAGSTLWRRK